MGGDLGNMTNGDPHNLEKYHKKAFSNLKNSEDISEHNKNLLVQFHNYLLSQDLSDSRITRHLQCLKTLAEFIDHDIESMSKTQMRELVAAINQDRIKDQDLADSTKAEYRKSLIKFYSDFLQSMKSEIDALDPDFDGNELTDFFTSTTRLKRPDPDKLPTPDTVRQLMANVEKKRDKAFLIALWSTGGRIGEILGLQWGDIKFRNQKEKEIAKVVFRDTKTGEDRKVPLRSGYVYLKELEEKDPESNNPDAWVFKSSRTGDQLEYRAAYKIIKRARERADIPNYIKTNPHAFRKGRATFLAAQGMNQATLCEYMGWVQGSDQAAVYISLAESDKEDTIMELSGVKTETESRRKGLLPVNCHECRELNKFEAETCSNCGETLSSSDLFQQAQIEEKTKDFKDELIRSDTEFKPEEINEKAKQFVKDEFNL